MHVFKQESLWGHISQSLFQQLTDITFTIESEKRLKEDLSQSSQDKAVMQNEIQGLKKAREALERRVVELQLKADRVQFLENEKRRYQEKILSFNEATELTRRELENYELKCKELEDERTNLEQLIVVYQQSQKRGGMMNEVAEQIIVINKFSEILQNLKNKQNPKFQSRLQKMAGDLSQTGHQSFSSPNLDNDIRNQSGSVNKEIYTALWKELQITKQRELRQQIVELTQEDYNVQEQRKNNQQVEEAQCHLQRLRFTKLKQMVSVRSKEESEKLEEELRQHTQNFLNSYKQLGKPTFSQPSSINIMNKGSKYIEYIILESGIQGINGCFKRCYIEIVADVDWKMKLNNQTKQSQTKVTLFYTSCLLNQG